MKYLRLNINNIEPLCVSDDSMSQSGQTGCCKYIPGTSIRGYVINTLSQNEKVFKKYKKVLFSDSICFLNAYPADGGQELIPSLKGFYEDKNANGHIRNVLIDGTYDEGMKRAALGNFCRIDEEILYYYSIGTESIMKITIGSKPTDQKVFRSEHISAGYSFISYIAIGEDVDTELYEEILKCFDCETVSFGNMRSQGFGKCKVTVCEDKTPQIFSKLPQNDLGGDNCEVYMILLSNTVMRGRNGEYCGLDTDVLAGLLDVADLKIKYCSTSVVTIHGYNRTIGLKSPTVPMYEQGSVFHLSFSETISRDRMLRLVETGIGEKKNEGFGRILFLNDKYSKVSKKEKRDLNITANESQMTELTEEDRNTLKTIARSYYRRKLEEAKEEKIPLDEKRVRITKSQAGIVLSVLENNRFDNTDINKIIGRYFDHKLDKEKRQNIQKERESIGPFAGEIIKMLNSPTYGELVGYKKDIIMGFKTEDLLLQEESRRLIIDYVIDLIRFGGKN